MDAAGLLKQARRQAGLSQRELAGLTGMDQAVVARIEAGSSSPRFDTLERLLGATGHRLALAPDPPIEIDRPAIRAAVALPDPEREQLFFASNANMLALFAAAREP